jgi:predicted MFS family arabinose efflux permease
VVGTEQRVIPRQLRRERVAVALVFGVHGSVMGSFAGRVPWVAGHVGVDVGALGLALLMIGLGALLAMPLSARLAHRHDLRPLLRVLLLAWCAALLLPGLATSLPALCAALAVFGATAGLADVAMNAEAVLVERRYRRSVMSSMHGCWSLGGLAGAAAASLAARANLDGRVHFAVAAAVLAIVGVLACGLVPSHRAGPGDVEPPAFALPSRAILPIGLVGLCAIFGEGASQDWAAVYLHDRLHSPAGTAALAVATFSLAMATTRLAGDRIVRRVGAVTAVRLASVCATAGALTVVLSADVAAAVAGFALLGVGVAVVVPLVFAAAGRTGTQPGTGIAAVAGIAYGSGLIAPGIIGGIAQVSSLTASFGLVALLTVVMGLTAGALRPS